MTIIIAEDDRIILGSYGRTISLRTNVASNLVLTNGQILYTAPDGSSGTLSGTLVVGLDSNWEIQYVTTITDFSIPGVWLLNSQIQMASPARNLIGATVAVRVYSPAERDA